MRKRHKAPCVNVLDKEAVSEELSRVRGFRYGPASILEFNPLPREPVQRPEQEQVETALPGMLKHLLELGPFGRTAGLLIHVFGDDLPGVLTTILSELRQLVLGVLPAIFG